MKDLDKLTAQERIAERNELRVLHASALGANDITTARLCQIALGSEHSVSLIRTVAAKGTGAEPGPWYTGTWLDGPGPARRGWGRRTETGGARYLGRTMLEVARRILLNRRAIVLPGEGLEEPRQ